MGTSDSATAGDRYVAAYDSAQFQVLRRRSNSFIVWASVIFYGGWFVGISLAAFVPDFFRTGLDGALDVGLIFLIQAPLLVVAVSVDYIRFASARLDPLSEQIRANLESGVR